MRNLVQTTPFMHVPIGEFEAAVQFFEDVLGFNPHMRVRDYAYLERDGCGIRIWGRENPADAPRGVRNFRYYFDVRDVDALYAELKPKLEKLPEGDVHARLWIRAKEIEASLGLLRQLLDGLPDGPVAIDPPSGAGEGMALVEAFRGEILTWVRLGADGRIERCHPRDPSWFQWPLLEAAIEGNIVADFPLCNKSFNCSYSGHDL